MKRFYKIAEAGTAPGGYVVRLDGKPLKTPLKAALILPQKLAEAVALEWAAQGDEIKPSTMPLTQLSNTMTDKSAGDDREEMNAQVLKYGGSDLVCYFAAHPDSLVRRQKKHWQPLIDWLREKHGVALKTVSGIQYHHQTEESLKKLEGIVEGLDKPGFTVVQAAAAVTGSVVIALALLEGKISAEEAYQAACVDELFQLEQWGEDAEARKNLEGVRSELAAIERFRDLVTATS